MGVSGFFDRSADEAARRLGVGPRFRDTDPRPLPDEGGLDREAARAADAYLGTEPQGIEALIPTRSPIVAAEDERLIASLAAFLAHELRGWFEPEEIAPVIRAWRDGQR